MPLVIPDEGEVVWARRALYADGAGTMEALSLRLYTNNKTPAESDTVASYTEVVAGTETWYAAPTLASTQTATTWAAPTSVAPTGGWSAEAAVAESTYNAGTPQSWTKNAGAASLTIYGYFLVFATSGKLAGAELFASAITLVNGASLSFVPRLGFA